MAPRKKLSATPSLWGIKNRYVRTPVSWVTIPFILVLWVILVVVGSVWAAVMCFPAYWDDMRHEIKDFNIGKEGWGQIGRLLTFRDSRD